MHSTLFGAPSQRNKEATTQSTRVQGETQTVACPAKSRIGRDQCTTLI
ncbi:hypothetical protein TIFTF001_050301 [Ficus carica]|uniref:Uncharacterized protein n=1 Tax=Ficus carica TaxID=3494 RepID=A0AA88CNX1_FICCA|nr:hypothetical protein TIFTF001_050301 [Ficus carica]